MHPKSVLALLAAGVLFFFFMLVCISSSLSKKAEISFIGGIDFLEDSFKLNTLFSFDIDQDHLFLSNKSTIERKVPYEQEIEENYTTEIDSKLLWGTYKPHLLYSVTQATPKRSSFGLLYQSPERGLYHSYKDIKDTKIFSEYLYHDGEQYAQSILTDKKNSLHLQNHFFKEFSNVNHQKWSSITVKKTLDSNFLSTSSFSLVYYFILENLDKVHDDKRFFSFNPKRGVITIKDPSNNSKEYFKLVTYPEQNQEPVSLAITEDVRVFVDSVPKYSSWDVKTHLNQRFTYDKTLKLNVLPNNYKTQNQETTFVAVQFIMKNTTPFIFQAIYSNKKEDSLHKNYFGLEGITQYANQLLSSKFLRKFPPLEKGRKYEQCSISSFSNLLSGLSYSYGPVLIKNDRSEQPSLPLFTATPSKTQFPRGFLWDEGFHGLLYCQWDPNICLKTLTSWMETQLPNGWIPREQARGPEVLSYADMNYVQQIKNEANPPTLLFHVSRLIQYMKEGKIPVEAKEILQGIYPKLRKWFEWFKETQGEEYDGKMLFQWKSELHNRALVLGSGLDDYPRGVTHSKLPFAHLDLQAWMIFFCENLITIAEDMESTEEIESLKAFKGQLLEGLNMFIDPKDNIYKDLVQDQRGEVKFSPHFGYVNLFPLFFGYIKEDSKELETLLDYIQEGNKLWTHYGLRSLAKDDEKYMKTTDSYWGGPIWINLNYLTLRGLKLYYSQNEKAKSVYERLRLNLIENICKNKEKKGYFFEQYNQDTGEGQRNYPFNGWTALVGLIIHEKY